MNNTIRDALYSFVDEIDNSDIIKQLDFYRNKMNESDEVKELINIFNKSKQDNTDIQKTKIKLYENEIVSNYLHYEQQLNYIILGLNKDLNNLIGKKGCR